MSPDLLRRQRGLSLIEVVVCMLILALGMLSGMGMTRASQAGLEAGRRISAAAAFAQAKMEEEISLPYQKLIHGNPENSDDAEGFIRTWTIQNNRPYSNSSTIRVEVDWTDKTGQAHSLALVTIRSKGVVP
ncbi:MAG TPA: prepilin-type N-terminal cleavage/methylation domain-containing protein [Nitrospiria bacterium]|nr:prepilin-type N-terminal cleavage/methylation domain-containing protein [Nitrospiria bacterium]